MRFFTASSTLNLTGSPAFSAVKRLYLCPFDLGKQNNISLFYFIKIL